MLFQRPLFLILLVAFVVMLVLTVRSERKRVVSEKALLEKLESEKAALNA